MSVEPRHFQLDESKVKEKMINFRRTVMEDEQREITAEMSKFLSKHVGISHNILRSFISQAISLWQTKENMLVKDINDLPPDVRFQFVEAICRNLKTLLIPILKDKEQTADLENAMDLALGLYKELRVQSDA
ncbi:MAG: hypothetical protein GPJ54_03775 [Candidatus Heimdallarchaeota archaeon]|nr:hypothetical protein [Candidatus Heimdallarchaeota archaeon]